MDLNFDQNDSRIAARISAKTKQSIADCMKMRGMTKVSQFLKLALQNQIKADQSNNPKPAAL